MDKKLTVGQKIKQFRNRAGISQLELEMRIETSPGSISRIESGEVNPTKETIEKIVSNLELTPLEASDLFNIDINSEFDRYVEIVTILNIHSDLSSLLKVISNDLIKYINGKYSVVFLFDEKSNYLEVASLNVPGSIKRICGKFIGYDLDKVRFDLHNKEVMKNFYVRSFISQNLIETNSVYDASYPLLDRNLAEIAQKVAGVKLILAFPMIFNSRNMGVLGVVLEDSNLSKLNKNLINNFNSLISSTIYRFTNH